MSKESLIVIGPVNALCQTSLDYWSSSWLDRAQNYDDDMADRIAKMAKRLRVQLKSQMLGKSYSISILSFSNAFNRPQDTNEIHKGAVMCLFHNLVKKPAGPAINAYTCLCSRSRARQERKLASYLQVLDYLFETNATDKIIVEAGLEILNFKKPAIQRGVECPRILWTNALCCGPCMTNTISRDRL